MTTVTVGSGGDYSTLQAAEDAKPANLVTHGSIWQIALLAGTNLTSGGNILTIAGSTVDATHYTEITCASGASFADHASKLTNALRWNSANGASISCGDNYDEGIIITEQYARLTKLQIQGNGGEPALLINGGGDQIIDRCIIEGQGAVVISSPTGVILKNSLFVKRASGGAIVSYQGSINLYNCTLAKPSDIGAVPDGITGSYTSGSSTTQNCAIFGCTNAAASTGTLTHTSGRTNDASPPSGFTQIGYDTTTGSGFENISDATRDFRIKSTSAMIDVGTTDATNAPTDIVGTTRPQGASFDIGVWEFSAASTVFDVEAGAPILLSGSLSIAGDVSIRAVIAVVQIGTVALQAAVGVAGDIEFLIKRWRVPTSAPFGTPVHVIVLAGSGPSYSILAQGDTTVDASGYAEIAAGGVLGTKSFALVHNYDDDVETGSIFGGPAVAEIVDAG